MKMPGRGEEFAKQSQTLPADRRQLTKVRPVKLARWPRTERRQARIATVLARRQPDLTVILENVHDLHNVSAVLRSCDAVGVLAVHLVYTIEEIPVGALARTTSASAAKWIDIRRHDSIADCFAAVREAGMTVLCTALTDRSTNLYNSDLRLPTALVFGNEMRGVSDEALAQADGTILIPMMGMVQSLNVSVACAVTLYEALRQRAAAGFYDAPRIDDATRARMSEEWLKR